MMNYRPELLTEENVSGSGPWSDRKTLIVWMSIWLIFYGTLIVLALECVYN